MCGGRGEDVAIRLKAGTLSLWRLRRLLPYSLRSFQIALDPPLVSSLVWLPTAHSRITTSIPTAAQHQKVAQAQKAWLVLLESEFTLQSFLGNVVSRLPNGLIRCSNVLWAVRRAPMCWEVEGCSHPVAFFWKSHVIPSLSMNTWPWLCMQ